MKAKHKPVKEFPDHTLFRQMPPHAIVARETGIVVHSKQPVAVRAQLFGAALGSCTSQMHETGQQLMEKEQILADRENDLKRKDDEINEGGTRGQARTGDSG